MSAPGAGAITGTPGPSVRVTVANGITQVLSSPHAIHRADISWSRTLGRWLVTIHTAQVQTRDFRHKGDALRHAGTIVGALYRVDMRSRFTGPQRHALALGQCPMHVACADPAVCSIERADHKHLCRGRPDFMSIWCVHHQRSGGDGR